MEQKVTTLIQSLWENDEISLVTLNEILKQARENETDAISKRRLQDALFDKLESLNPTLNANTRKKIVQLLFRLKNNQELINVELYPGHHNNGTDEVVMIKYKEGRSEGCIVSTGDYYEITRSRFQDITRRDLFGLEVDHFDQICDDLEEKEQSDYRDAIAYEYGIDPHIYDTDWKMYRTASLIELYEENAIWEENSKVDFRREQTDAYFAAISVINALLNDTKSKQEVWGGSSTLSYSSGLDRFFFFRQKLSDLAKYRQEGEMLQISRNKGPRRYHYQVYTKNGEKICQVVPDRHWQKENALVPAVKNGKTLKELQFQNENLNDWIHYEKMLDVLRTQTFSLSFLMQFAESPKLLEYQDALFEKRRLAFIIREKMMQQGLDFKTAMRNTEALCKTLYPDEVVPPFQKVFQKKDN